ncbi:membrane lipoprotein [Sphingobacterium sp. ML3W]|nr:membrane lipoprotein [Sphingobacterium sp. ML3W]
MFFLCKSSFSQQVTLSFGEEVQLDDLLLEAKPTKNPINWINVNTASDTWRLKEESLICTGLPIGVMRSEKQYENFIIHVEWNHINAGGNSGIFVWSDAIPDSIGRLPGGVEVQMLELDWVNQNEKDGIKPPIAYVHGELFGVGGVETIPDNPRGTRSKSIENRAKGKGEWNKYTVICVDGTIKLAVNGKFVNGIRQSTIKKGYLCLESEGSEIHFRNFKLIALEPGVTGSAQIVKNLE